MSEKSNHSPEIVTTDKALDAVCRRLASETCFAFDTEFVAEDRYARQVCLIQVATDSFCALIDPVGGLDTTPFWELVVSDDSRKVVHSGAEDIAISWRQIHLAPVNVFDTQLAAGMAGLGYPISLARLVRAVTDARLRKSQTLTDWRKRPLSSSQVRYAVEDVVHLPEIHRHLSRKLAAAGREPWLEEECRRLCEIPASQDEKRKLRRLRGTGSLARRELAIAEALLDEREKLAVELDRPPRVVLRDHLLVELARRGWTDVKRIRSLRGINLSAWALKRLIEAIERALALPAKDCPSPPVIVEDSPEQEALADLLTAVLRDYCNKSGVAMSLLTNKQEIRAFVRSHTGTTAASPASVALDAGWRRSAVSDLLGEVVSGRTAIRVAGPTADFRLLHESPATTISNQTTMAGDQRRQH